MTSPRTFVGALALTMIAVSSLAPSAAASWSLVWSDEFNGSSLDPASWTIDIGNGCPSLCGWGNNELQWYRPENVGVTGGNLVLTAREETYGTSSFTSGKVLTRDKRSFLYGRVEMRAKIPTGGGMWPAFWMMPQDDAYGGWAASGELDIMESSNATTSVGGTIHYGGSFPNNTYTSGSYSLGGTSFADDFHIYAVEWEPDVMRWYVDDVVYSTKTSAQWYSDTAPGNPRAPFDQPFFIILNAAVGGNYTGCTSPGCITASLPQEYLIDYVRVYEDIPNLLPTVAITSPSAGGELPAGDITIEVTASDGDGTIVTVEFYDGATYLGEDTTAPYSFVWPSVSDGCYRLMARAIDNLGGTNEASIDITVGAGCGQLPFVSGGSVFPTRIEAEDYDLGGEGVAYHDEDASNNGGQYRPAEGVDIESTSDSGGGYNVGWLRTGEWIEYSITVPVAGTYTLEARVASLISGGTFHLEFDGVNQSGDVTVPITGNWQNFTSVPFSVTIESGPQIMRFQPTAGEFNLNYFDVVSTPTAVAAELPSRAILAFENYPNPLNPRTTIRYELQAPAVVDLIVYDAYGRRVRTLARGESSSAGSHTRTWNGRDDAGRTVAGGVYYCRLTADGESDSIRMILLK